MADFLLVDMGNTRCKWIFAADQRLDADRAGRGSREQVFEAAEAGAGDLKGVLLSSVADPATTGRWIDQCRTRLQVPVLRARSEREHDGVTNGYERPETLGVDRWLAILGAVHRYRTPVVVMDLGTATTLDAVDEHRRHLGGLILPGPETMLKSLASDTAMNVPERWGADSGKGGCRPAGATAAAIHRGVLAAQIGALEQFIGTIAPEASSRPRLVVTGGGAAGILGHLDEAAVHDPFLVFRGLLRYRKQLTGQ